MRIILIFYLLLGQYSLFGQYTYWNNVYPELSDLHNFRYSSIIEQDNSFKLLGWGADGDWNFQGWRSRTFSSTGELLDEDFAPSSMLFAGISETFVRFSSGNYIGVGTKSHGFGNYHPYVGCLNAQWDTLWHHDLMEIVNDSLQIGPKTFLETVDNEILIVSSAYFDYGNFDDNEWGYHFTFLDENSGEILSDTLRWMEDDFHYNPSSAVQMSNGDILLSGLFVHDEHDSFVIKTNLAGDILETLHLGNPDNCPDGSLVMDLLSDTTLIVAYSECIEEQQSDLKVKLHLLQMNPSTWTIEWDFTYDIPVLETWGSAYNFHNVETTPDGGFVVCLTWWPVDLNSYNFPTYLLKFNSLGTLEWSKSYQPTVVNDFSFSMDMLVSPDGGFVVTGEVYFIETNTQRNWVFKTDPCGDIEWVDCPGGVGLEDWPSQTTSLFSIFPNPTNDFAQIKLSSPHNEKLILYLYDMTGREIFHQLIAPGQQELLIDIAKVASGHYLTILTDINEVVIARHPLQKL